MSFENHDSTKVDDEKNPNSESNPMQKKTFKKSKKVLLSDDVKKINHIKSEHKRRNLMKEKHMKLIEIVPKLNIEHPKYADEVERIKTGVEPSIKKEFDPDLEFVLSCNNKSNDPSKQLEKLVQAIHSERSIYKLSKEYLLENYAYNAKLKEYISHLISTKQIELNDELSGILGLLTS